MPETQTWKPILHSDPATGQGAVDWVYTSLLGTGLSAPPSPMLRRRFHLQNKPAQARLRITALGLYEPWINGQRIGELELQPGWTDYHQRLHYQEYDVTEQLQAGNNIMGAWLGDGWYSGRIGHLDRGIQWGERPALLAELEITDQDGAVSRIGTDSSWQWKCGDILSSDILNGEQVDARKQVQDWCNPVNSDDGWSPVETGSPGSALPPTVFEISPAPPVKITQELSPVCDPVVGTGNWMRRAFLFDLGQNFTGKIRLKVTGPTGATLQIRYAEVLTPDGLALDTSNLRTAEATDRYTLAGSPTGEIWTPKFTFHGFRYVEISYHQFWDVADSSIAFHPFTRETVTGLVMHNDMPPTGSFETGHALLNQLHRNISWGLRSNFLEVPTDCPQRDERLGWTGDAQIFAPTATFHYDVRGFFEKWLNDLADSQETDGKIPSVAPNVIDHNDAGAGWSDAVVLVPWTMYQAYGDRRFLDRHYDTMKRWIEFQTRTANDGIRGEESSGLFPGFGDWLALDGDGIDPSRNATPKSLIGTAYHAHSLHTFSKIAAQLGHTADVEAANSQREIAIAAFKREFMRDGKVTTCSQTSHLMALAFDLVPDNQRAGVFADLLKLLDQNDGHLSTGFLGTPLWCDVLTDFDRHDRACDLLLQESYPGWLYPVTLGATTMWERWNSWHPERGFVDLTMNSLNHYAYGAVGDWMVRHLGGIQISVDESDQPRLRLNPYADARLGHCRVAYRSPWGEITSHWECDESGDTATYRFSIPHGLTAKCVIGRQTPIPLDAGEHRFTEPLFTSHASVQNAQKS